MILPQAAGERTIVNGEVTYITTYPGIGYATLAFLGGAATPCVSGVNNACVIDNNLAATVPDLERAATTLP